MPQPATQADILAATTAELGPDREDIGNTEVRRIVVALRRDNFTVDSQRVKRTLQEASRMQSGKQNGNRPRQ